MSRSYTECTHLDEDGLPRHSHGTRTMYQIDRCGCRDCSSANQQYTTSLMRLKLYGRYEGRRSAAEVRVHLRALMEAGISLDRVVELTGLNRATVRKIAAGQATCEHRVANVILDIDVDPIRYAHPKRSLDGVGTSRRLQALCAIGWTQRELAARLKMNVSHMVILLHGGARVEAQTIRAVRALYDDLWDKPQEGPGPDQARRTAQRNEWVSPLAWDDEDLDDPTKGPAVRKPSALGAHVSVRYADVIQLLDAGVGYGEVLRRTGVQDLPTLRLGLIRAGRRDLADSFPKALYGADFEVSA